MVTTSPKPTGHPKKPLKLQFVAVNSVGNLRPKKNPPVKSSTKMKI